MATLQPVDETFLDSAPVRFSETFAIPKPAPEVWAELTREGSLDFCRALKGAHWISPRPFGVGTSRIMKTTGGALSLTETYFRWEEGRRKSFYVEAVNLPLFKRFAEDYLVEPDGDGCRFTWTIAAEPTPLGRPGAPVNRLLVKSMFADTRKHFGAR
jgi:hypothetical protein